MKTMHVPIILFSIFIATPAYAEVMDKEPSLMSNYMWGFIGSLLCYMSARYKPLFLFLVSPLPLIYFFGLILEINDPFVGKAILNEAGLSYILSSYILGAIILVSIGIGLWLRKNEKT